MKAGTLEKLFSLLGHQNEEIPTSLYDFPPEKIREESCSLIINNPIYLEKISILMKSDSNMVILNIFIYLKVLGTYNVLFASTLIEYGVFDELLNLLYCEDEDVLKITLATTKTLLDILPFNSENKSTIFRKFQELDILQKLRELREKYYDDYDILELLNLLRLGL